MRSGTPHTATDALGATPSLPPRLRKPWVSTVPRLVLEWFEDLRAEGRAKNTAVSYALDLKDLAGFLTVPLEEASPADLRAFQRSLPIRNLAPATILRQTIQRLRYLRGAG